MARTLDLTGRKIPVPPTAPPATPGAIPGITGRLPLPVGHVVQAQAQDANLTPDERRARSQSGVGPDTPLPRDTARSIQAARAAALRSVAEEALPPPVPLNTPPARYSVVPIDSLPAAERERLLAEEAKVASQWQAASIRTKTAPPPATNAQFSFIIPDEFQQQFAENPQFATPDIVEALDRAAELSTAAPVPPPPPAPAPEVESVTGLAGSQSHCPHCDWPLTQPDPVEPDHGEKLAFLHAVLGQKPYIRTVNLMGGQLQAVFRTLTTAELDLIHQQTFAELTAGKLSTEGDFHERVSRLRTFAQLQHIKSPHFDYELADGLTFETNPRATGVVQVAEGAPVLLELEKFLLANVLTSETLFRVVNYACRNFNRIAAKMEAMVDNVDFWNPTGASS